MQIVRTLLVAILCATPLQALWSKEFPDPLQRSAPELGPLLQKSRVSAIARAGSRLVAVGPRGAILVSDDAAQHWRQVPVPVSSDLVAVRFHGERAGWAVGHDGVILHSDDGGLTWKRQLDGLQAAAAIGAYYQRAKADPTKAVNPALIDEAERFAREGADKPFFDIAFISDTEGFAVGAFNLAMRTVDGGATWTPVIDRTANPKALHLYALAFSGSELYLVGEQGLLRRWNAEAERFEEVKSPYGGSFFGLIAKGDLLIAYGLQGTAFRSRDRGETWDRLNGFGRESLNTAAILPDGGFVFASQGGRLFVTRDAGDKVTEVAHTRPMPYFGLVAIPSSPGLVAVAGARGVDVKRLY